ncbi:MAG: hypothetical protein ACREP7_22850 [Lysobacter sp.]
MNLHWRLFVSSKNEAAARKLVARHFRRAEATPSLLSVEVYEKGGFRIEARSEHATSSWSDSVVAAIALAQRSGRDWCLRGLIIDELSLWSETASTAGIDAIEMCLQRVEHRVEAPVLQAAYD